MSLSIRMAGPSLRTEDLLDLYHFNRLHLRVVKRMRLELHAVEIDLHQIYAADCAVPCCPVVESYCILICDSSELSGTWKILRNILCSILNSYWKVEIVEKVESLHNCVESCRLDRGCCLEECRTHEP